MPGTTEPIRGKVARVLSDQEIVINKGSRDGVEPGMIFNILRTKGSEVTDPDTGEVLGSVDLAKAKVKVTTVKERIAVASTYRTQSVNVGGEGRYLLGSEIFQPPKWETRFETLKIVKTAIQDLDDDEAYVNTGDPVVQHPCPTEADDLEDR